ncbi:transcription factor MYC2-like [Hibiscus syriacus]|uniref:Transcription factor MYC2-like n=1 Tax=Hibiscus syriacus TaxID=106335 RepID=A0A6A3AZ28_HIBSY|nr:transcription factor MYC2-like [Hibiscus syriacus]
MGGVVIKTLSFVVFSVLDLVDFILCFAYKVADFCIEAEWRPCYRYPTKEAITSSGGNKILVSEQGESKIVSLNSSKLQLQDISDTLYSRPSLVTEVSKLTVDGLKKLKLDGTTTKTCKKIKKRSARSTFTVNSIVVETLQGKMVGHIPTWSDCDCKFCNSWTSSSKDTLFVNAQGPKDNKAREDVIFIHGFISSSAFWTETLFPNFSSTAKSTYRFLAVDLLGFGRSPKPADSLYTLSEHVDMIEKSVLEDYKVKSFHIVAHSLGCILALAIAVKHPGSVKSLTLLTPPYYPVPKGEATTQYVMRKLAPRRVWPVMAFCASLACWVRTYLMEGFFCHTHNAAWHTLHNIICGTATKLDRYLDVVRNRLDCNITIFHGEDDQVIPVKCSYDVQRKIPRARVKVAENKDHITIVVGRQKTFARELEEIWNTSSTSN